jgi:putative membrane protein
MSSLLQVNAAGPLPRGVPSGYHGVGRRSSDSGARCVTNGFADRRHAVVLGLVWLALWFALAIDPVDRETWLLENALVAIAVPALALTWRAFRFSRVSYTLIFVFLCLHAVGAHFTYSLVPYDAWFAAVSGTELNALAGWERNHYDRLVHFAFGLLLVIPVRELVRRTADVTGFWGELIPVTMIMASSVVYELIEWGAAMVFGGDLGMHYLGAQGDEWDGHRDMALASAGAVLGSLIARTAGAHRG